MKQHLTYDAAISFAGEQRLLARSITNQLSPLGYSIFYDAYNISETWGRDISEIFHTIYSKTPCILIIATKEYVEKAWTTLERRSAVQNSINNPQHKILQIKSNPIDIPGIPSVMGYYPYKNDLNQLCSTIAGILGPRKPFELKGSALVVKEILRCCFRRSIFTNMNDEIDTNKMFDSIAACISLLHQKLADISNAELSQFIKGIIVDLNDIDRFSKNAPSYTCLFNENEKMQINSLKLKIIDKLHYLNYNFKTRIDLPNDIGLSYGLKSSDFEAE